MDDITAQMRENKETEKERVISIISENNEPIRNRLEDIEKRSTG